MKLRNYWVVALLGLLMPLSAFGANYQNLGNYQIHYNAFSSTFLSQDMAKLYQIRRSKNRGVLTVSVLEQDPESGKLQSVEADVDAHAVNLTGQLKQLNIREVRDREAIYHIAEFRFSHKESLDFEIEVSPEEWDNEPAVIRFRQQFYSD